MVMWNPWHGCRRISEGCDNCYAYGRDCVLGIDASFVRKTKHFDLPASVDRFGRYKFRTGECVFVCMTSDFFIKEADDWRMQTWKIMLLRRDLVFFIITKRINRFSSCIPSFWPKLCSRIIVGCTVENKETVVSRLEIFRELDIKNKVIVCAPLLEKIDLTKFLNSNVKLVSVSGESGLGARICDYEWVLDIRRQCVKSGVDFHFKQTGRYFRIKKKIYKVSKKNQDVFARKMNIDIMNEFDFFKDNSNYQQLSWNDLFF